MANPFIFLALGVAFLSILYPSEQLQSSQAQTLLRIQRLLNNPPVLTGWNGATDFCNLEPNSFLTVVCYERSVTQLHIIGSAGTPPLPRSFSMDSFVTTLVRLPNLKVLTLASLGLWGSFPGKIGRLSSIEIFNVSSNFINGSIPREFSSLTNLQTLILDGNMFEGPVPDWFGTLPILSVLSLRRNSFNGSLPGSFTALETLRVLALSHNRFYGKVPDLSSLKNLQVLDLEDNGFDGQFPRLGNKLTTLVLKRNQFRSGIPAELSSFYRLQQLDLSFNNFVGPLPLSLLSLPSISYIDIAGNKFTGMLSENQSCNDDLMYVDLSSNLLAGKLPDCLSKHSNTTVVFARNCLSDPDMDQQPLSFCHNQALAVGIVPEKKGRRSSKTGIILGVVGAVVVGFVLVVVGFFVARKIRGNVGNKTPPTRLISERASSTGYTSKLFTDARYIYHTMKLGALGLPAYRTFSLEELEESTGNFDTSAFMGEGSQGQMYKGQLKNGSLVAIRCLKMKKSQDIQNFMHHIELISKLRHRHVVSALGHCFECYWDDSSVSRIFLVFEYIPNGTLRNWISGRRSRQLLNWSQRITAAIGVARGIQFLHTGIVPGLYANNLKITDVLLDQNLTAKISSYNLPLLGQELVKDGNKPAGSKDITRFQLPDAEKSDIYDFGVILLELIVGSPLNSKDEIDGVVNQLQSSMSPDGSFRRSLLDPTIRSICTDESLKTVMEICVRCLQKKPTERPSVEDVVWNLQFAAQVQDGCRESQSSDGSPPQRPRLSVTMR